MDAAGIAEGLCFGEKYRLCTIPASLDAKVMDALVDLGEALVVQENAGADVERIQDQLLAAGADVERIQDQLLAAVRETAK
jgi:hypothetical protein